MAHAAVVIWQAHVRAFGCCSCLVSRCGGTTSYGQNLKVRVTVGGISHVSLESFISKHGRDTPMSSSTLTCLKHSAEIYWTLQRVQSAPWLSIDLEVPKDSGGQRKVDAMHHHLSALVKATRELPRLRLLVRAFSLRHCLSHLTLGCPDHIHLCGPVQFFPEELFPELTHAASSCAI